MVEPQASDVDRVCGVCDIMLQPDALFGWFPGPRSLKARAQ